MKNIILFSLIALFLSCSKPDQVDELKLINMTVVLPVGINSIGEPSYMEVLIDGVIYTDDVYTIAGGWKTKNGFNLFVDTHKITALNLFDENGVVLYRGAGYFDLEVIHYISEDNPITVFESAFNEIGLSMIIFPKNFEIYEK